VGAIAVAGEDYDLVTNVLAFIAVTCSTINVVGGFLITDRILKMFKKENTKDKK
jgi:NAD(P) transhydrogenase subunit alpha